MHCTNFIALFLYSNETLYVQYVWFLSTSTSFHMHLIMFLRAWTNLLNSITRWTLSHTMFVNLPVTFQIATDGAVLICTDAVRGHVVIRHHKSVGQVNISIFIMLYYLVLIVAVIIGRVFSHL